MMFSIVKGSRQTLDYELLKVDSIHSSLSVISLRDINISTHIYTYQSQNSS